MTCELILALIRGYELGAGLPGARLIWLCSANQVARNSIIVHQFSFNGILCFSKFHFNQRQFSDTNQCAKHLLNSSGWGGIEEEKVSKFLSRSFNFLGYRIRKNFQSTKRQQQTIIQCLSREINFLRILPAHSKPKLGMSLFCYLQSK